VSESGKRISPFSCVYTALHSTSKIQTQAYSSLGSRQSIPVSDIGRSDIAFKVALSICAAMPKTIYRPEYTVLVELVRELRLNAGLTQTEVSEKLGITQPKLSDVERGSRRLDLVELRDLAVICGTSLPEVVTELEARLKKRRAPAPAKRR